MHAQNRRLPYLAQPVDYQVPRIRNKVSGTWYLVPYFMLIMHKIGMGKKNVRLAEYTEHQVPDTGTWYLVP